MAAKLIVKLQRENEWNMKERNEKKMELLNLQDIAGGALHEKVNVAMKEVLDNMHDKNTPWKNKRRIFIELAFSQNEDRDDATVELSVKTKTAPVSPVVTRMSIGKDLATGENYAEEYGKQVKGQMSLDDYQTEQVIGNDVVDTDTGEVVGSVTNFRRAEA